MKIVRILTKQEERAVLDCLAGKITYRGLANVLNTSPQRCQNLIASICREWFQAGKLKSAGIKEEKG